MSEKLVSQRQELRGVGCVERYWVRARQSDADFFPAGASLFGNCRRC